MATKKKSKVVTYKPGDVVILKAVKEDRIPRQEAVVVKKLWAHVYQVQVLPKYRGKGDSGFQVAHTSVMVLKPAQKEKVNT